MQNFNRRCWLDVSPQDETTESLTHYELERETGKICSFLGDKRNVYKVLMKAVGRNVHLGKTKKKMGG